MTTLAWIDGMIVQKRRELARQEAKAKRHRRKAEYADANARQAVEELRALRVSYDAVLREKPKEQP